MLNKEQNLICKTMYSKNYIQPILLQKAGTTPVNIMLQWKMASS